MTILNINRYLLSIYAVSSHILQRFQASSGLDFKCRFLVF